MQDANPGTLVAHAGAIMVSREALRDIPTPKATATHRPVPHHKLVDTVEMELGKHGMWIAKQEFAVLAGDDLFGVLTLKHSTVSDFSHAIGLRTSNRKKFAITMVAGGRVFVCDNLALSGDAVVLKRKHTSGLNVTIEIRNAITEAVGRFQGFDNRITTLKSIQIGMAQAKSVLLDAVVQGAVPRLLIPTVLKNYQEPPHEEFAPRTPWSLHNAATEALKTLPSNVAFNCNIKLGKLFRL